MTVTKCTDKCARILFINDCLQKGQVINVENLANNFNVSCRSVHRDIDTIRIYYAADDLENEYFFIIDEINRGNLSKIFGELFMLIENDKRGNALQLLYSDEKFFVPANVYIRS